MRSNLRWCSDGLEFACRNGEVIRMTFIIDVFDREIIAWTAVTGAGISGSNVRVTVLGAVERRFGSLPAPHAVEHLSDSSYSCDFRQPPHGASMPGAEAVRSTGQDLRPLCANHRFVTDHRFNASR